MRSSACKACLQEDAKHSWKRLCRPGMTLRSCGLQAEATQRMAGVSREQGGSCPAGPRLGAVQSRMAKCCSLEVCWQQAGWALCSVQVSAAVVAVTLRPLLPP